LKIKNAVGTAKMIVIKTKKPMVSETYDPLSRIVPISIVNPTVLTITKKLFGKQFWASNSLPSLFKNIPSLIKIVLEQCLTINGTPIMVSHDVIKLKFLSSNNKVNCQPHMLSIQNIRFHNLSLLNKGSTVRLSCINGILASLLLTAVCIFKFCVSLLYCGSNRAFASFRAVRVIKSCIILSYSFIRGYRYIVPKIYTSAKQIIIIFGVIISLWVNTSHASTKAEILRLISDVEAEYNIPSGLLSSIAKTESNLEPYALNISGRSMRFQDKDAALQAIHQSLDKGITNIDIGVAQVNYKWHQHNFNNLEDMLLPKSNIKYAAKLLSKLKQEHGDWHKAIRYYHSANPDHYIKYSRKIVLCWLSNNKLTNSK
jgi:hypothetical protein